MNKQISFAVYLVTALVAIVSLVSGNMPIMATAIAVAGLYTIYLFNKKK